MKRMTAYQKAFEAGRRSAFKEVVQNHYDKFQDFGNPDHLRELVEAEKEGRLVKLPCKEDDEVYVLLIGRVIPFEVTSVNLDGRGAPLFRAMHGLRLMYMFRPEDIDKTVFLTREEAETVLKEEIL